VTNKPPNTCAESCNRDSVKALVAYCQDKDRVCPMPQQWDRLWKLLPNRSRVGSGWEPPLPLILGAWHEATGLEKMHRLTTHIEWAAKSDALEPVKAFLYSLKENQWFHLGD
jgi:hypothetical protein